MGSEFLHEDQSAWTVLKKTVAYASLACLLGGLILVWMLLRKPALPFPEGNDAAAQSFNEKVQRLLAANEYSMPVEMHFTADELNSQIQQWLRANPPPAGTATMKNGAIHFEGDRMIVLLAFDVNGFEVYMTIDGHLTYVGHFARLDPSEVHIGRAPIPVSMLEGKIDLQMELPEAVTALRVEDGELVIEAQ